MPDFHDHPNLVALVDAVIKGRVSAVDAGFGTQPVIQEVFAIAENLGNLSRGRPVKFTPAQARLLDELIDFAVDIVFSGKRPSDSHEIVATRLMDLAFDLDEPMSWAVNLSAAGDGTNSRIVQPAR